MQAGLDRGLSKLASILDAEVSSRSLGFVRIFGALSIYIEFASPWVSHRMDDMLGTLLLSWIVLLASWFVVFGWKTRIAAAIMATGFAVLHLYYGVHLGIEKLIYPVREFQLAVLLAVLPCGRSLSVDRVLEVRRAQREHRAPAPERVHWWQLELFVLQLTTMLFWFGVDGCRPEWLDGSVVEFWFVQHYGSADIYITHPDLPATMRALARALTCINFTLAFGLLLRRLRPVLTWAALVYLFLGMLAFPTTYEDSYEPLFAMVILIACVPPSWMHALVTNQTSAKQVS